MQQDNVLLSEYVSTLLQNDSVNLTLIPDSIESKFYHSLFSMAIGHLQQWIQTFRVQFLEYELRLILEKKEVLKERTVGGTVEDRV